MSCPQVALALVGRVKLAIEDSQRARRIAQLEKEIEDDKALVAACERRVLQLECYRDGMREAITGAWRAKK